MTEKSTAELKLELETTSANNKAGGDFLNNVLDSTVNKQDEIKLFGHRGVATDDVPITVNGTEVVTVDTYNFTIPDDMTYKCDVIIRWRLTVANTSAIFNFELDGQELLVSRIEPKDGNNEDYLYVFGLVDLTAGAHSLVTTATKSAANGQLIITGNAVTREIVSVME